jgi:hypothetical protein
MPPRDTLRVIDATEELVVQVNRSRPARGWVYSGQPRKSVGSVYANLVDGYGRGPGADRNRLYVVAKAECEETLAGSDRQLPAFLVIPAVLVTPLFSLSPLFSSFPLFSSSPQLEQFLTSPQPFPEPLESLLSRTTRCFALPMRAAMPPTCT